MRCLAAHASTQYIISKSCYPFSLCTISEVLHCACSWIVKGLGGGGVLLPLNTISLFENRFCFFNRLTMHLITAAVFFLCTDTENKHRIYCSWHVLPNATSLFFHFNESVPVPVALESTLPLLKISGNNEQYDCCVYCYFVCDYLKG